MSRRNGSGQWAGPIPSQRFPQFAGRLVAILVVTAIASLASTTVTWADESSACRPPLVDRQRFGYTAHAFGWHKSFDVEKLRAGWYVDHSYTPTHPDGMDRSVLIKVRNPSTGMLVEPDQLISLVDSNPGATWLLGNEPDCIWQDDVLPEEYARLYHGLYTMIKSRDRTAQVAAGGIVQPTPLRLQYLDMVLAAYRSQYGKEMPVDVWHIHNAVLNEQRGGWGAEIPPGINAKSGEVRAIDDNDNLAMFKAQIWAFRQWMADRGYRNYPLIVSEYGVLMPDDYGFTTERVNAFMSATFDFFRNTKDSALGDPADGNRLVQRWAWFSLDVHAWDGSEGFNGNLFDPKTKAATPYGLHYASFTGSLPPLSYTDLGLAALQVLSVHQPDPAAGVARDVKVRLVNLGTVDAGGFEVQLTYSGSGTGSLSERVSRLDAGSSRWITFRLEGLVPGAYTLSVEVDSAQEVGENAECNNEMQITFVVPTDSLYLPLTARRGFRVSASQAASAGEVAAVDSMAASPREQDPGFEEFLMPTGSSYPAQIALDLGSQTAWITERDGNKIAQFDLQTRQWVNEFTIPTANSQPWGLALDAQGRVWFAESAANKIGVLNPATGKFTEYVIPTGNSQPWAVAIGDDGTVWFTERSGNKIGRLFPATGQFVEYELLTPGAEPSGIDVQGAYVWFTMPGVNQLARLRSSDGRILEFTPPTPGSSPQDVALNPRGKPWFTLMQGNKLLFIDIETHGLYTEFPVPTPGSQPLGLALDGDTALWFTERAGNKLGRLASSATMRDYALPTANSLPTDIAVDGAGCAWYTAPGSNRIGRFCAPPVQALFLPVIRR